VQDGTLMAGPRQFLHQKPADKLGAPDDEHPLGSRCSILAGRNLV